MKRIFLKMVSIVLFSLSFSAFGANLSFMYDTPEQYFNNNDWKMFNMASDKALSKFPNGQTVSWNNPKTGSGGTLKPLNLMKKQGRICRDLQIINHASHRTSQYVFMFCKFNTGWKIPSKKDASRVN